MTLHPLRRASAAAVATVAIALAAALPASASLAPTDFESGNGGFWGWGVGGGESGQPYVSDGMLCGDSTGAGLYNGGMGNDSFSLTAGDNVLTLTIHADGPVPVQLSGPTDADQIVSQEVSVDGTAEVSIPFTLDGDVDPAKLIVFVGEADAGPRTVCIDDVSVQPAGVEQVVNGTFDDGLNGWTAYGFVEGTARVEDGMFCATVPAGTTNPWDVAIFQDLSLVAGEYSFSFDAKAAGPVRAIVQQEGGSYASYGEIAAGNADEWTSYQTGHVANADPVDPRMGFQVGGAAFEWEFCLDNASYLGGVAVEPYEPETGPRVRVNQVGYLANGPKEATLVTDATDAVGWELMSAGSVVASGDTVPLGTDASAGQNVHGIDFSSVTAPGTYTLVADGEESYEFEIGTEAYQQLRYDSLNYFYLARSGIDIDGDIVGDAYAREAGHVSSPADGVANKGDLDVPCQNAADAAAVYTDSYGWAGCDYTLDVLGGWYDAGDHGKYVVNGGIAAAQLMGAYERTKTAPTADAGALGDSTLNLPETGNDVPDVLDEARWQLDFMMSMQVPEGEPFAGMVHHKIHDDGWTGLPLLPANDPQVRELHRPSTAATLNLAATAAQGARLFAPYDADYADELLATARSTWAAALATPDLYAPVADGADGGGPYDDDDVTDEFYWAAAELFLTTGEQQFEDYLMNSDVDAASDVADGFYWGSLAALAKLDLATVPNDYAHRDDIVDQVIAGADALLATQQGQEFGLALDDDGFEWGSNSAVLNNQVILGTAFDLTGNTAYADAVVESMDYLLGRNALNLSYITGYGDVFSENQHSRWFSHQLNAALPHPPAGSVAGGPNADYGTWDPTISGLYPDQDCAPQRCYVDHIQSWSTNEITVNWNSALSWVASWLADYGQAAEGTGRCEVSYTVHGSWPKGYNTQIWIKNTSTAPITSWQLTWAFPGDDAVTRNAWSAQWSQEGAFVTADSMSWNGAIKPGKRVTIGFIGDPGSLADAAPEQFWLNGVPCTTG